MPQDIERNAQNEEKSEELIHLINKSEGKKGPGELEDTGVLRDEKGRVLPGSASLNPTGRPKGAVSITKLIREALKEQDPHHPGQTMAQTLAKSGILHAIAGDSSYFKEIANRIDGKVPDHIIQDQVEEQWEPEYIIVDDPKKAGVAEAEE